MELRLDPDVVERIAAYDLKAPFLSLPFAVRPDWEPEWVSEARVMWNATGREPYWPVPYIISLLVPYETHRMLRALNDG